MPMPDFSIDPNIAKAKTLHTDFYNSEEIFERCKETIFANSWQFIGNSDLVKESGDVYPFTLLENYLDEPLLLTKDKTTLYNDINNYIVGKTTIINSVFGLMLTCIGIPLYWYIKKRK